MKIGELRRDSCPSTSLVAIVLGVQFRSEFAIGQPYCPGRVSVAGTIPAHASSSPITLVILKDRNLSVSSQILLGILRQQLIQFGYILP